jgi:hypothetical protein
MARRPGSSRYSIASTSRVTPVGRRASRYFYAVGTRVQDIDPGKLERLFGVTTAAFHEDKRIIEAQQKLIDEPDRPMLPTSLDAGPTQFRKLVDALAR